MSKKIAVFFPGRKYSVDCPLLYFADFVCKLKGYERAFLHYARHREEINTSSIEADIQNTKAYVTATIQAKELDQYDEVVFVSKSLGTVLAGYIREALGLKNVRNIYLTPLTETLPYIEKENSIVVAGTNDSFLPKDQLKAFCQEKQVKLYQMEGLGHSLETDKIDTSLTVISNVSKIIEEFLEETQ